MNTSSRTRGIAALAVMLLSGGVAAQDLVITNARMLDGTGRVIERGTVVVRAGKIVSVGQGAPAGNAGRTIDAGGKTVMPGFIDAHRHLIRATRRDGSRTARRRKCRSFSTRVSRPCCPRSTPPPILEARKQIADGDDAGPAPLRGHDRAARWRRPRWRRRGPARGSGAHGSGPRGRFTGPPAPAIPREATIQAVRTRRASAGSII